MTPNNQPTITSLQNPFIKHINKLKLSKHRKKQNEILIQGFYPVKLALQNNYPVKTLILCPQLQNKDLNYKQISSLLHKKPNINIVKVSQTLFKKISYNTFYEGIMAIAQLEYGDLNSITTTTLHKTPVFYLLADGIENTSTLGGLFRIADNTGVDSVIITNKQIDVFHPGVIRSGLGAVFTVKNAIADTSTLQSFVQQNNVLVVATSPTAKQMYNNKLKQQILRHSKVLLAIGSEHKGLSKDILQIANLVIKLPMLGQVESLSATATASAVLYNWQIA